jgi:hypothetical protein
MSWPRSEAAKLCFTCLRTTVVDRLAEPAEAAPMFSWTSTPESNGGEAAERLVDKGAFFFRRQTLEA